MIEMGMIMMTLVLWGIWAVKPYSEMTIKEQMRSDLHQLRHELYGSKPESRIEHWSVDRFNWMLNGDFGRNYYEHYLNALAHAVDTLSYRRFRSIVINAYTTMLSLEYDCSYGHAQKCLVEIIDPSGRFVERLNQELIQQAVVHYNDLLGEEAGKMVWFNTKEKKIENWDDGGVG